MCFTVSSFIAHSQYYLIGMCLFTCRSYEAPSPDHRAIADSVSSLVTAVQNSLSMDVFQHVAWGNSNR